MKYDANIHRRHSIRLFGYNYSHAGSYFVTLCVRERKPLLGEIRQEQMRLNPRGQFIQQEWENLPSRFPSIQLNVFTVMPNHLHGIITLVGAELALPSAYQPTSKTVGRGDGASSAPTLGRIIQAFKSISTIQINRQFNRTGKPFWQRNYYEHIIRNEKELNQIRDYIATNPERWDTDEENPDRKQCDYSP